MRLRLTFEGPASEYELEHFKVKVRNILSASVNEIEDTGEPYYSVGMMLEDEQKKAAENS